MTEKGITSENIAFGIAPRLNASGRLDTVESAVKVLISDNLQEVKNSDTDCILVATKDYIKVMEDLVYNSLKDTGFLIKAVCMI